MDRLFNNYRLEFLSNLIISNLIAECGHNCRNDEERFIFALEIVVRNSVNLFGSECEQKNSKLSIRLRENGNKSFKDSQYYLAVQKYTESIVYAPDSSEQLALAYANRSAALFKLEKYADCVEDIDRALLKKYPDGLKTKLYRRKGLCLTKLGSPGADSAFKEALVWLDKMDLNNVEMNGTRSELSKLSSAPCAVAKPSRNIVQYLPPEIVTANPEIPCASDAVAIKYSKKFGRHLVATRQIKPGEILILEKPHCLRLIPKNVYTHCSYCLRVSWNLIPCTRCVNVAYCSETCKDKAWNEYHEVECPIVGLLLGFQFNNVLWMSVRTAIMAIRKGMDLDALKQELTNVERNTDPRTKGYSDDGKFHSHQYRSIYSLANNINKCSTQDLFIRALWVALTVCMLARETMIFGKKLKLNSLAKNPDVIFVGGLILKNVHTIFINAQSFGASRYESRCEHGHAVMAVSNLLNHSCDANTLKQWYADCMAIYAAYPIEQGEQVIEYFCRIIATNTSKGTMYIDTIFENYGPRATLMSQSERQVYFRERWHFKCECQPCIENWPLLEYLPSYKRQSLPPQNKIKLDKVLQKFRTKICPMQKDIIENSPNVLNELLKTIELLFQLAQRPCRELIMAVSMLKDYYEAADAMFDYVNQSVSKIVKERSLHYQGFQLRLARQ